MRTGLPVLEDECCTSVISEQFVGLQDGVRLFSRASATWPPELHPSSNKSSTYKIRPVTLLLCYQQLEVCIPHLKAGCTEREFGAAQ